MTDLRARNAGLSTKNQDGTAMLAERIKETITTV
jgi:hypothetical protein